MKKIFMILTLLIGSVRADSVYDVQSGKPKLPQACEIVEAALLSEISNLGQARTVDDNIRIGKIYKALTKRGCPANSATYTVNAAAAFEIARALVEVADLSKEEVVRYGEMIRNAE